MCMQQGTWGLGIISLILDLGIIFTNQVFKTASLFLYDDML